MLRIAAGMRLTLMLACVLLGWRNAPGQCQFDWWNGFNLPGLSSAVETMAVLDDGSGTGQALFVAGSFDSAGNTIPINGVGKWDGTTWTTLGEGVDGQVLAIASFDDGNGPAIYASAPSRIWKWDGVMWHEIAFISGSTTYAMAVFDDGTGPALYAGGTFVNIEGVNANHIAKWDGKQWLALGTGGNAGTNDTVYSLAVHDDGSGPALFVGGAFTTAGGNAASRIAKWNGTSWQSVGSISSATGGQVLAMAVFDNGSGPSLFVGGTFTFAGGVSVSNIARRTGTQWASAGSFSNGVNDLKSYGTGPNATLHAAVSPAAHKWNGTAWTVVGSGMNGPVNSVQVFDDGISATPALYVGGDFSKAGALPANCIARWNGFSWTNLAAGDGVIGRVNCMASGSVAGGANALYAAGALTEAGQRTVNRIGKWTGTGWSALGSGLNNEAFAIGIFDLGSREPNLYTGGLFTQAGGIAARCVAKWDGQAWSPLGSGLSVVYALEQFDDGTGPALYAGGPFDVNSGDPGNRIAKWDGTNWVPLGTGLNNHVNALEVFDDGNGPALYAGGLFTTAGGNAASGIAKWNGTSWSPLDTGVIGQVWALQVFDDGSGAALYAGGRLTQAGSVSVNDVAKWDGKAWSQVGTGIGTSANEGVADFTVLDDGSDPVLVAGGLFTTAGGSAASCIAKWDGSAWSAFGDGVSGSSSTVVDALAALDDDADGIPALYVGGFDIRFAGDFQSRGVARWGCPLPLPVPDCDDDGLTDWIEIASGAALDCNANCIHDSCDIDSGPSNDLNANGIPDECEPPPTPAAQIDACANAKLVGAGIHMVSSVGATTDGPNEPGSCSFNDYSHIENDVWLKYLVQCSGTVRVSLCGSTFNAKVAVYVGCPTGPDQLIACSDDFCGDSPRIMFEGNANNLYRIRIGGYLGATGIAVVSLSCSSCPADVAQNGTVGVPDLLTVINGWGPCPSGAHPCPADINGDLIVDVLDLSAVINAWGSCQ